MIEIIDEKLCVAIENQWTQDYADGRSLQSSERRTNSRSDGKALRALSQEARIVSLVPAKSLHNYTGITHTELQAQKKQL